MYTLAKNSVYICTHYLEDMLASILVKCYLRGYLSPDGPRQWGQLPIQTCWWICLNHDLRDFVRT